MNIWKNSRFRQLELVIVTEKRPKKPDLMLTGGLAKKEVAAKWLKTIQMIPGVAYKLRDVSKHEAPHVEQDIFLHLLRA